MNTLKSRNSCTCGLLFFPIIINVMAASASSSGVAKDLTIVVTTSPIPSMPSTALLQALLRSFEHVHDLSGCRVIVVCDGIGEVLRAEQKPNWKCSRVNPEHVAAYKEYTSNVERLARCQQRALLFMGVDSSIPADETAGKTCVGSSFGTRISRVK